jgi:hypothetical protein
VSCQSALEEKILHVVNPVATMTNVRKISTYSRQDFLYPSDSVQTRRDFGRGLSPDLGRRPLSRQSIYESGNAMHFSQSPRITLNHPYSDTEGPPHNPPKVQSQENALWQREYFADGFLDLTKRLKETAQAMQRYEMTEEIGKLQDHLITMINDKNKLQERLKVCDVSLALFILHLCFALP